MIAIARIEPIALLALRPRHEIDDVVEFAALLRALGRILSLKHAHQSNLGRAPARHVQCFHHARQTIAFQLKRRAHRLGLGTRAEIGFRRRHGWLTRACIAAYHFVRRSGLDRGLPCLLGCRGRLDRRRARLGGVALDDRFGSRRCCALDGRSCGLRVRGPIGPLCFRRLLQQDSGELGDRLHGVRPFLARRSGQGFLQMQGLS
jgi:hypothetical protein